MTSLEITPSRVVSGTPSNGPNSDGRNEAVENVENPEFDVPGDAGNDADLLNKQRSLWTVLRLDAGFQGRFQKMMKASDSVRQCFSKVLKVGIASRSLRETVLTVSPHTLPSITNSNGPDGILVL